MLKMFKCLEYYVLIVLLFMQTNLIGQSAVPQKRTIDSLMEIINSASHDTSKIAAYIAWDNLIYISDPKLDEELNQKIVAAAEKNLKDVSLTSTEKFTFKKSLALALNSLGIIFYNKGESFKALDYYTRSLEIRTKIGDKKGIAATLNNLGTVYQGQAENDKAIDYYTRSLEINEEIRDQKGEANCLGNIGRIYQELADTLKAIDYQTRSLKIRESIGDKRGVAIAYSALGSLYTDMGNEAKAMKFFNRSLTVSEEIGDKNNIALALGNIGFVYKKIGASSEALDYLNRSLKIFEEIDNKRWIAASLNYIGDVYKMEGEIDKAIPFYKRALLIAQEGSLVSATRDAGQALYNSYKLNGNYKEALAMHELFVQMRDSILNETNQKEVLKQDLRYTYEKQRALDEKEHEKQMAVSAERAQKQNILIYAGTGSILLILGFTIFAFNRLRLTRRQNKEIEKQKNIVEEKQKEILASFTYAKRLQDAILPPEQYIKSMLSDSFILYKPKDIVAGDFYWMERKKDTLFLAVADGTGHGIPGAIISVICSNALNMAVLEAGLTEPGKILDKTRELVLENFSKSDMDVKDGMDISLISINFQAKEIKWSGANNPLWYISSGKLIEIKANKQAIGKTENPLPFTTHTIRYNAGDIFYLFTDGYPDQFGGPHGKKLKHKALKEMLLANHLYTPSEQKDKLDSSLQKWMGNLEQVDDICIIGVRI
jgi:serine phosphatase RsbU (regulator of sigma subunit)